MKKITIVLILFVITVHIYPQQWQPIGTGTNGAVNALNCDVWLGGLFAGGDFTVAGGLTANHFVKYQDGQWSQILGGIGGPVNAISKDCGFIGGQFTFTYNGDSLFNFGAYNYVNWIPYGSGLDAAVEAITFDKYGNVCVGGTFISARYGPILNHIGKWNSNSWHSLGNGTNGLVHALCRYGDNIIAAGTFTAAGGNNANFIAMWDGNNWSTLGSGTDAYVHALIIYNGDLIAGGQFNSAGGVTAYGVAKWNGISWSPLGNGLLGDVRALTVFKNSLVAGGTFSHSGTTIVNNIARWNGNTWEPFGSGTNGEVYSLCEDRHNFDNTPHQRSLVAGGDFTTAGGLGANYVARWTEPDSSFLQAIENKKNLNLPIGPYGNANDSVITHHDNYSLFVQGVSLLIDTVNFPNDADLEFYLIHQSVTDTIVFHAGGSGANFIETGFDDSGPYSVAYGTAPFHGEFIPERPLSKFNNLNPDGVWILKIHNNGNSSGILEAWSLSVTYGSNPIGITPISTTIPDVFSLHQNYPNPFNPETKIKYEIHANSFVRLTIYDITGRQIVVLVNENQRAGTYEINWNAINYSSGVYFYKLSAGDFTESKKMILIK